jgi:hypothetical protein
MPYLWTRWAIGAANAGDQQPVVFYIHPWEIDPDQPRLMAPAGSRFRHYVGLASTASRLRQLLDTFEFAPVSTLLQLRAMPEFGQPGFAWSGVAGA